MSSFIIDSLYTRAQVWSHYHPDTELGKGGHWSTGYVVEQDELIVFANINTSGRTGHDFPNSFNAATGKMAWFGKPNAHSAQPTFRKLFDGNLKLQIFVRWDNKSPKFLYLGQPSIDKYDDGVKIGPGITTIELSLSFSINSPMEQIGPLGNVDGGLEGNKQTVVVNRYERDPALRIRCIEFYGSICQICNFNFEAVYGEIGRNFCHVHHITPLGELFNVAIIDPIKDLIPVCPNCHSMLHRKVPALKPDDIKALIYANSSH